MRWNIYLHQIFGSKDRTMLVNSGAYLHEILGVKLGVVIRRTRSFTTEMGQAQGLGSNLIGKLSHHPRSAVSRLDRTLLVPCLNIPTRNRISINTLRQQSGTSTCLTSKVHSCTSRSGSIPISLIPEELQVSPRITAMHNS